MQKLGVHFQAPEHSSNWIKYLWNLEGIQRNCQQFSNMHSFIFFFSWNFVLNLRSVKKDKSKDLFSKYAENLSSTEEWCMNSIESNDCPCFWYKWIQSLNCGYNHWRSEFSPCLHCKFCGFRPLTNVFPKLQW